jgi:hypothetical protein
MRLDARLFADQRPGSSTSFITETELTGLVNSKIRQLYDMLVEARGSDYYATEDTISIVSGTARYNLPANFYQLASITLEWATNDHELMFPVGSTRERIHYEGILPQNSWSRYSPKAYRLRASQLEFLPTPTGSVTARLQYVPVFTALSADGDTFDGINGWEKMVALGVAMEMRTIEKRPSSDLAGLYAEQMQRIEALKTERDAEAPLEIVDVERLGSRGNAWGRTFGNTFGRTFG